jgi:hypothetical protein
MQQQIGWAVSAWRAVQGKPHDPLGWGAATWHALEGVPMSVRLLCLGRAGYLVSAARLWSYLRRRDDCAAGSRWIAGPAERGR